MDNRDRESLESSQKEDQEASNLSPWARYWARQRRIPQDSHLVSFGNKVTYTFAIGNDVASVHYDKKRGEIFYKGHKIDDSNMETWLVNLLNHFKAVLAKSEFADDFLESYTKLVEKMLGP